MGGLRDSGSSPGLDFFRFRRISRVSGIGWTADASLPYVVYRPSAGSLGYLASTRNLPRLRGEIAAALRARGGDMIPLEHRVTSADIQLCRGSCKMCYLSGLVAILSAVPSTSTIPSRRLSLIVLPKPWDDDDILKNLVQLVQEVVFETTALSYLL